MTDDENLIKHWNYRLFEGDDGFLTIGEVYYNEIGNPVGWKKEPATVCGDNVEEIIKTLKLMVDAVDKPIFRIPEKG